MDSPLGFWLCFAVRVYIFYLLFEEQYSAVWQNAHIFIRVGITFNDGVGETTIFALVRIPGIQWQYLTVLGQAFIHLNLIEFLFKCWRIVVGILYGNTESESGGERRYAQVVGHHLDSVALLSLIVQHLETRQLLEAQSDRQTYWQKL